MAQLKFNDIADTVGDLLDRLEETDLTSPRSVTLTYQEVTASLRALHAALEVGRRDRDKAARAKAKSSRLSTGAEVPLWGDGA